MKTIAFDNSKGVWRTRYSFVSSCIGWIKGIMISAPKSTTSADVLWSHNDNSVTNNSFYGASAVNSTIAVSFNDHPSVNKQFKAVSVETNNPSTISGFNTFSVNRGSGNGINKDVSVGALKERGGIMYGHIGQESRITLSNFEFIGVIKSISPLYEHAESVVLSDTSISTLGYSDASQPNAVFIDMEFVESSAFSASSAKITKDPLGYKNGTYTITTPVDDEGIVMYKGGVIALNGDALSVGDSLYFIYGSKINGEAPKGQHADAVISFGNDDFEVYGVNLEYAPTTLDHNS